jgi:argininosuccinate synthase
VLANSWIGSSKSVIHKAYPTFVFEDGFQEEDLLWRKDERETAAAQDIRTKVVLDDVFSSDKNTWISISSHSGEISSLLRGKFCSSFGLEFRSGL